MPTRFVTRSNRGGARAAIVAATPLPLLGSSEAARHALRAVEIAAGRSTPLLLLAEPGCRPVTIVEALHARTRAGAPFVAIDCGAADPAELDRRLFGVPRRAAPQDLEAIGPGAALAAAGGGTLFLEN